MDAARSGPAQTDAWSKRYEQLTIERRKLLEGHDHEGAMVLCERIGQHLQEASDLPETRTAKLNERRTRARLQSQQGRSLRALLELDELIELCREWERPRELGQALNTRATVLSDNMELDRAEATLREALEHLDDPDCAEPRVWTLGNLGVVQLQREQFAQALATFEMVTVQLLAFDSEDMAETSALNRASCLVGLDRPAEARQLLAPFTSPGVGTPLDNYTRTATLSLDAECQARCGDPLDARPRAEEALRQAESSHNPILRIEARRSLVRVLRMLPDPPLATALRLLREALGLTMELGEAPVRTRLREEVAELETIVEGVTPSLEHLLTGLEGDLIWRLGLTVARQLAGRLGGSLVARERDGGGAVFSLRLSLPA